MFGWLWLMIEEEERHKREGIPPIMGIPDFSLFVSDKTKERWRKVGEEIANDFDTGERRK